MTSLRLRPTVRLLPTVAFLVALAACTGTRQVPDKYGDTTSKNFKEGCVETLTSTEGEGERYTRSDATSVCDCSYDGITDPDRGIPFEEFKTLYSEQEDDPSALPQEILDIVDGCRDEVPSR